MTLEDEVLDKITPDSAMKKKALSVVEEVTVKLRKKVHELGLNVEPILVGSVAKDTALSVMDIDIFLMFQANTSISDLERFGLELGASILKGERRYAQHPYTHGEYKGFTLDIVPCYRIESPSQKMSAVDRTPFHTEYVKKNLNDNQKGQVRLLKQFLKGIGAYGAEAEVQGFSGYLCELLVLKFGTFEKVLEATVKWHRGTFISLNDTKSPKFEDPFIVVDPIDAGRNAAAAVSVDSLSLFIHSAREYLKDRKVNFFFPKTIKSKNIKVISKTLKALGTHLLGLSVERPKVVDDVLFSQVRKCEKAVAQLCEQYGFRVLFSKYFVNDSCILFIFEFEILTLPKVAVHIGPPVWHLNSDDFIRKWTAENKFAGPYICSDRWAVDIMREFCNAGDLLKIKLGQAGVGKDLSEKVNARKFRVISEKELLKREYAKILSEFFDKRFPWER